MGDLTGDEFQAAARAFMVEENARDGKQVVGLTVIDGDPVPVHLGDAVRAARVEGGGFTLRHFVHLAEHLAGGSLIEARLGADQADSLQQAGHPQSGDFAGENGLVPGGRDEGLRCQVVQLVRAILFDQIHQ